MQIAFHLGVHGTDDGKVVECLAANAAVLRKHKVELSPGHVNEPILNEALGALKGGSASPEMEEVIEDALLENDDTRRLVISRANLLGPPRRLLENGGILIRAEQTLRALAGLMPRGQVEFFIAIKNPATMAPDVLQRMTMSTDALLANLQPSQLRWAPTMQRLVQAVAPHRLVVWCNEDTPLLFPDIVREIADLPTDTVLASDNLVAEQLLTGEGKALLGKVDQSDRGVAARRGATAAILAEHHDPSVIKAQVQVLDWDQDVIDALTAAYDADVAEIAALPGVEFIHP